MSLYKRFLAYSISSTSTSNCMATTARSENRSSDIVSDQEQVLIHFISENDHSASVHVISRVQAMSRRRWMFGKTSSSQATSGSFLSVDCQSVFHLLTSFPRDLENGISFSQNSMPSASSSSCSALFTIIDGTIQSRWRARRSSSKIDRASGWLRSQEEE